MQVETLSTSADGRLYLARRADAFVIGELETLAELCRFPRETGARQVLLHPDSRRVVVDSEGGTVEVLEIRTGRVLRRFDSTQRLLALDPEGTRVFCNDAEGLMVRDVETGRPLLSNVPWLREMRAVSRVEVLGDDWILVAGEPGSFVTHLIALQLRSGEAKLLQKNCSVQSVWPLPDRRRAIVIEQQGQARLWDVAAGEQVRGLTPAGAEATWAHRSALDDAGRRLLALSLEGAMREVSVADGKTSPAVKLSPVDSAVLDANRRAVVSVCEADQVKAWSVESNGVLHSWRVPGARRSFRVGTRWFAGTSTALVLLEGDRTRVLWEGGSAPTALAATRGNGLLVGTGDGAVYLAGR